MRKLSAVREKKSGLRRPDYKIKKIVLDNLEKLLGRLPCLSELI